MAETKPSLVSKLAKIGNEIGIVKKSGKNREQNYDFIEYAVVAGRIRELFNKYNLMILPKVNNYEMEEIVTQKGRKGYHYVVNMTFTIINGDDLGEKFEQQWLGEATDYGDKGINKAETSATKYFLMRLFNVSEKGEEEADKTTPEASVSIKRIAKKINIAEVETTLKLLVSGEELDDYWRKLKPTPEQQKELIPLFKQRKEELASE